MKKALQGTFIFVLVLALLSGLSYTQSRETGSLVGIVSDTEQNALPGTEVTITSPNMIGGAKSQITDASGGFRFVLLQPGTYAVEARLEGFAPQRRENVRLFAGSTLTVDFLLEIGTLSEEIIVIAESPLIDVKDSQLSTIELDDRALNDVVYNQEMYIYSVIDLAPGTEPVYHGSTAFGGQARAGNSYMMDGIEIGVATSGNSWGIPDAQSFEEAKIMGIGAAAEYDGFSGVQLNMITKSGGNAFDGMAQAIYQGYDWITDNFDPAAHPLWSEPQEHSFQDARFAIGGPVILDKLWFYGSVKWLREGFKTGAGNRYHKDQPKYFAKLTWQVAPSTRIALFRHFDDWVYDYRYTSYYRPKSAASFEYSHNYTHNFSIFHTFTEKTFVEAKLARTADANFYGGYAGDDPRQVSGHYNADTGIYSENFAWYYVYPDFRNAANAHLSHHADEFLGGSHDFKFGVEFEQVGSSEEFGYNGTYYYIDDVYVGGAFHDYAYNWHYLMEPTGTRISFYAQDAWNVTENFTVNPGIRLNTWKGTLASRSDTELSTMGIAPRLGLTWDIFGDHTTAFKIHFGKYYDKHVTRNWKDAASGVDDWVMYEVIGGNKVEILRDSYSTGTLIDPDIKMPHMYQFSMGIERELMKDVAMSVTLIYKKMGNFIRQVNTGATYTMTPFTYNATAADGTVFSGSGSAYAKTSPSSQDSFMITNPQEKWSAVHEDPWRTFLGLFIEGEKRFSNNWMFGASYSMYKQKSTYAGRRANTDPNDQLLQYWDGELVSYWSHNLKIYGSYILPGGFTFSPMINYRTGPRDTYYLYAPVSGSPDFNVQKPGSLQHDHVFNFDLRLEKTFTIQSDLRVGFMADVYNVFNVARVEGIQERVTHSRFGLVDDFNFGRQYKIGLRIYF